MIKMYLTVDEDGEIIELMAGAKVMEPDKFDYYFESDGWEVAENSFEYKVVDGELVHK